MQSRTDATNRPCPSQKLNSRTSGASSSPGRVSLPGSQNIPASTLSKPGAPLIFTGALIAPSTVRKIGKTGIYDTWFDTAGFAAQPSFTRRSNPWYFDALTGPGFKNMDLAISKRFNITERLRVSIRLDAFNALNGMNWATPNLTVTASDFGKTNTQATGYFGRQVQYSARLEF